MLEGSSINALIMENESVNLTLSKIKRASYNKHWLGVPIGLLSGTVLAFFVQGIAGSILNNPKNNPPGLLVYTAASILIGSVIGWIVGYDYKYQFNP